MRIQKKFQGTVPENKILNVDSESETDTYSCSKINELIDNVVGTEEEEPNIYSGTEEPDETLGKDGDIYIKYS